LIEEALTATDENCSSLDRHMACYGHNQVEAAFLSNMADDYFVEPADLAHVTELATIATAGLNEDENIWGVAVMNLQANIPNTLPGQNVRFVLMGDQRDHVVTARDQQGQAFVADFTVAEEKDAGSGHIPSWPNPSPKCEPPAAGRALGLEIVFGPIAEAESSIPAPTGC